MPGPGAGRGQGRKAVRRRRCSGGVLVQRAQLHEDLLALLLGAAQRDHLERVPPTRRRAVPHQLDEAGASLS